MSNLNVIESNIFTLELSNDSFLVKEEMGIRKISILNSSPVGSNDPDNPGGTTTGSIKGNLELGGVPSGIINLEIGESFTLVASEASVIKNLQIASSSDSCLLKIVAQQ